MRALIVVAALVASISPALAQSATTAQPVAAKRGSTVYDSTATRLGTVLAVRKDGAVVVNFRSDTVTLPATSLSVVGGKLTTSLTRAEVAKLD